MISYGYINEKGADEPDPAYMHHCKEVELRDDSTSGDGLNGSVTLDESDLKAVGADTGDYLKIYAEANDRWILYQRQSYNDYPGIGIPRDHREKLGIDYDNRTVRVWIDEAENVQSDTESDSNRDTGKQVSLTSKKADKQKYVLIPDDSPIKFHHVSQSDKKETECGIHFGSKEHRKFSDPGDALDKCNDCAIRSSDDMSNKEIVEWLGNQAGFEAEGGTPAYLNKTQLVALRDYVLDLQEGQTEDSGEEAVGTGSLTRTAVGRS